MYLILAPSKSHCTFSESRFMRSKVRSVSSCSVACSAALWASTSACFCWNSTLTASSVESTMASSCWAASRLESCFCFSAALRASISSRRELPQAAVNRKNRQGIRVPRSQRHPKPQQHPNRTLHPRQEQTTAGGGEAMILRRPRQAREKW